MADSRNLKAALRYAAKGFFVFPCVERGKRPLTKHGCKDASTDEALIRKWWTTRPEANVAIAPGPSSLVVLDVDLKSGGLESLEELCRFQPDVRDGWTCKTGGGGFHFYYAANPDTEIGNSASKLGPGLDVRGVGGYVIAPPSVHESGNEYTWTTVEGPGPPQIPAGLIERLKAEVYASREVTGEPIEARHATLMSIGGKMRRQGFEEDAIFAALTVIDEKQCVPGPLGEKELRRLVATLQTYEPTHALPNIKPSSDGKKKLALTSYDNITAEQVEWLLPGYIALKKFALGWGLEGRGKSYITVGLAADITRGIPLPGCELPMNVKPGSVLLFSYEDDPEDTIKPRLIACGADMSRVHTLHARDGTFTYKDVEALEATIKDIPDLQLVVLDPATSFTAGTSDISETEVRAALAPLLALAVKQRFALLGIKHANKREDVSIANRVSGSRAWTALARTAFLVGHDNTKEQAKDHTFGGVVPTKNNFGLALPLTYEIEHGKFNWTGADVTLEPERLFPAPKCKDKDK